MQLSDIKAVYFIGIGGIGMSAIARFFLRGNRRVGGYDKTASPITEALQNEGAWIHFEDDFSEIPEAFKNSENTLIVYTPAVPGSHKELKEFQSGTFQVKKRAEVLGIIANPSICMAVAGTHGKTTTSSILAHLLYEARLEVMAFLGGISEDFGSNYVLTGDQYAVVEADEFDRSFLWLEPDVACITSMDADHLDIYGTGDALVASFKDFASGLKADGRLIVRYGLPLEGITYGLEPEADYSIRNIRIKDGVYEFEIHTPTQVFREVHFGKPGKHNLLNGLAAFTMADQVCDKPDRLLKALGSFKGVQRRFTYKIRRPDLVYIDDYAHHPTEIDAVHQAVSEMHPGKRNLAVFQPHLFSRTRDFGVEFARSLSQFDSVLLLEIYPARETPLPGIDSSWLLGQIFSDEKALVSKAELAEKVLEQNPEVLVTLGAGDIGLEAEKLTKILSRAS